LLSRWRKRANGQDPRFVLHGTRGGPHSGRRWPTKGGANDEA
jgi:hypothetical protein